MTHKRSIRIAVCLLASSVAVLGFGSAQAASTLTYNLDNTVVGYDLPGIPSAGSPNFENDYSASWKIKKANKKNPDPTATLTAYGDAQSDFYFNLSPTESYEFRKNNLGTKREYELEANFVLVGNDWVLVDGYVTIMGGIDIDGDIIDGTLLTATLDSWAYSATLIGFATTIDQGNSLICQFIGCTSNESAYLGNFQQFSDGNTLDLTYNSLQWKGTAVTTIPVPAAAWLLGSALALLGGIKRRKLR